MKLVRFLRLTVAAGMLAMAAPALAGDTAELNVIGYSKDGKVFAFEEYGILDGSGGAYSSYYFLDTENDKFLPGTPIRFKDLEGQESLGTMRGRAGEKAAPLIKQYGLDEDPGQLVTYNPPSEVDSDPHQVRYYGHPGSPQITDSYTMVLKEKPFPASKDCLNMTGNFIGFTLALTEAVSKPADRVIFEDKQVPASRECPNGYRIGAVINSGSANAPMVAMIQYSKFGFEGNDVRWIAVPFWIFEH